MSDELSTIISQISIDDKTNIDFLDGVILRIAILISDFSVIETLLNMGIKANCKYNYAIRNIVKRDDLNFDEIIKIINMLLQHGADISAGNSEALRYCCKHIRKNPITYHLVNKGINIHGKDDQSLYHACCCENLEIVELLIKNGAHVDSHNSRSLISFWMTKNVNIYRALIDAGADIHMANQHTNFIWNIFRDYGDHNYELKEKLLQMFLSDGLNIDAPITIEKSSHTTLLLLSQYNYVYNSVCVKILLKYGADAHKSFTMKLNSLLFTQYPQYPLCQVSSRVRHLIEYMEILIPHVEPQYIESNLLSNQREDLYIFDITENYLKNLSNATLLVMLNNKHIWNLIISRNVNLSRVCINNYNRITETHIDLLEHLIHNGLCYSNIHSENDKVINALAKYAPVSNIKKANVSNH